MWLDICLTLTLEYEFSENTDYIFVLYIKQQKNALHLAGWGFDLCEILSLTFTLLNLETLWSLGLLLKALNHDSVLGLLKCYNKTS